jgi:hypothetical protein
MDYVTVTAGEMQLALPISHKKMHLIENRFPNPRRYIFVFQAYCASRVCVALLKKESRFEVYLLSSTTCVLSAYRLKYS